MTEFYQISKISFSETKISLEKEKVVFGTIQIAGVLHLGIVLKSKVMLAG